MPLFWPVTENPFLLMTLIAAPAVLTNACSVLALNTAGRYGRAFDRTRELGRELDSAPEDDKLVSFRLRLIGRNIARATLLLRAQTTFYAATGLFVLAALVALLGASLNAHPELLHIFGVFVFAIGTLATACLIQGCLYTVRETRLAMMGLREEQTLIQEKHKVASRAQSADTSPPCSAA
jgi:hypothetical protein